MKKLLMSLAFFGFVGLGTSFAQCSKSVSTTGSTEKKACCAKKSVSEANASEVKAVGVSNTEVTKKACCSKGEKTSCTKGATEASTLGAKAVEVSNTDATKKACCSKGTSAATTCNKKAEAAKTKLTSVKVEAVPASEVKAISNE